MNTINDNELEISLKATISRKDAEALGRDTYFTGKPCKHGHLSERYVVGWVCVACAVERDAKRVASGKGAAMVKRYREANPDRTAAQRGWTGAKMRGAYLPDDFTSVSDLIMATTGFYQEARRLTEETGKPHEVDHKMPLAVGGLHHPNNLRVVTAAFNRAKKNMTDLECINAMFAGEWNGPTDDATMALLLRSVSVQHVSVSLVATNA